MTRQMSAIAARPQRDSEGSVSAIRRHRTSNKPLGHMRDRTDDLRKVYGQAADLTEFERQHQEMLQSHGMPKGNFNTADQSQSYNRQRRGQSGRPGGRVAGLETIYMTKIPKLKPAMNMNVSQSNQK